MNTVYYIILYYGSHKPSDETVLETCNSRIEAFRELLEMAENCSKSSEPVSLTLFEDSDRIGYMEFM